MGEEKQKNLKWFLITSGVFLLLLVVAAVVYVHRQDFYCLYLYARCETWDRNDVDFKRGAIDELEKNKSVRILCWILDDKDVPVRMAAAGALGELGIVALHDETLRNALKSAIYPMIEALKDEDEYVRWRTAEALDILCEAASGDEALRGALKRAVEPLVGALKDKHWRVCYEAALALGWLGDKRAVEPLIEALKDKSMNVRRVAVCALGDIKDVRAFEPLIEVLLKDNDWQVRRTAAYALVALEDLRTIEQMIEALKDKNATVRWRAADALGELYEAVSQDWALYDTFRSVFKPLIETLKDDDADVRGYTACTLGKFGDKQALTPLREALKSETNKDARSAIEDAIKNLGKPTPETPAP